MHSTLLRRWAAAAALVPLAACAGDAARTTLPPGDAPGGPLKPLSVLGVYELTISGLNTGQIRTTLTPVRTPGGARGTLTVFTTGLTLENTNSVLLADGPRGNGGQRYFTFTYRLRNATGGARNNLMLLLANRTNSLPGTSISSLLRSDGTPADSSIAAQVVPTGAVTLAQDGTTILSPYPDVLQVLTESEVSGISVPSGVNYIFPAGFMVRNRDTGTRLIPDATSSPNQFDGELTVAFRLPRQATALQDVNSIGFHVVSVEDSETRLTESIEEGADTAAARRLRQRASFLGATTVTVLAGSPATDPAVPDYTGQRQICSVRTAGPVSSPLTYITNPTAYMRVAVLRPGESMSACGAYFRSGTPTAPSLNSPYTLTLKAVDRYGNVKSAETDTMSLVQSSGPAVSFGAAQPLVSGSAGVNATWSASGTSVLWGTGRRLRGQRVIEVPFGEDPGGLLRSH